MDKIFIRKKSKNLYQIFPDSFIESGCYKAIKEKNTIVLIKEEKYYDHNYDIKIFDNKRSFEFEKNKVKDKGYVFCKYKEKYYIFSEPYFNSIKKKIIDKGIIKKEEIRIFFEESEDLIEAVLTIMNEMSLVIIKDNTYIVI